jgi:methylmalonyl-CoA mutase N-terminal domain/subunit
LGGARAAIESGFVQREIGDSAYAAQRAIEEKRAIVVGVNEFVEDEKMTLPLLSIDESVERDQVARLNEFRGRRKGAWSASLDRLDEAARSGANLMPLIVACVREECTVGEIVATLKKTFGEHIDQGF